MVAYHTFSHTIYGVFHRKSLLPGIELVPPQETSERKRIEAICIEYIFCKGKFKI